MFMPISQAGAAVRHADSHIGTFGVQQTHEGILDLPGLSPDPAIRKS